MTAVVSRWERRPPALAVLLALVLGVLGLSARAAGRDAAAPPTVPYEHHGACPFECCTYRTWTVTADTDVRTDRRDGAPVAFRLRRGERVDGVTGVVVTTKLGTATVRRGVAPGESMLKAGEVVYVLHELGEGFWHVWAHGQFFSARVVGTEETCSATGEEAGECAIRMVEAPATVWWARIRNRSGQEGWTRHLDRFADVDACR